MTRSKHARFIVGLLVGILSFSAATLAQQTSTVQRKRKPATPLPAEFSRILFSESRAQIERPEIVMDVMKLKDGDVVADIGSGPGYYSLPVAKKIAPHGVVFAVDIQEGMLDQLRERMHEAAVTNIYPVLGDLDDSLLPPGKIDWILLVDAYHEFGEPEAMLARMREALAPDGRVALLEHRGEPDPDAPPIANRIPCDHKMWIGQVMSEWVSGGFELAESDDFLPARHLFTFKRDDTPPRSRAWHEDVEVADLELDGVPNLSAFGVHVFFAGQPDEAAFKTFAERGVKTVINLRTNGEMDALDFDEAATVQAAEMDYLHVPVGREPLEEEDLERIAAVLNGAGEAPVVLHCRSSNRVGFVWSIFRATEHGLGLEEALAEGKSAGMRAPQLAQRAREFLRLAALNGSSGAAEEVRKAAGPAEWIGDLSPIGTDDWSSDRAAHLLERAGFGGTPEEIARLAAMTPQQAVAHLVEYEAIDNSHLPAFEHSRDAQGRTLFDIVEAPLHLEIRNALTYAGRHGEALGVKLGSDHDTRLQAVADQGYFHVAASRYEMDRVVQWWAHRMVNTRRPLEEKLTLFWHGHFATGAKKVHDYRKMLVQNETFRSNAASDFHTLLIDVSQDPAMLVYLDNRNNVKGHPNENYAREILELFSMGVGNYTEEDIRETARALTGWTLDERNELKFVVRPELHDTGDKTIFGRTGNFDGEDVVDIILQQPVTARFIAAKLYRFFVREDPSPQIIDELAHVLRENNYAFKPFLKTLFLSRDFYSPPSYATQIKSPVHLMVSTYRRLGVTEIPGAPNFRWTAKMLGQEPGNPPNVAGWKGGRTWINPATLLERGNFVRRVFHPEQEPTNARVTYNFETRIGAGQGAMMTAAGMAAARNRAGSKLAEAAAGRKSRSTAMRYDGWDLYRAIAVGNRRARQLVPEIKLTPAQIDLAGIIEQVGLTQTEEVVDYFLKRFLRVQLEAERRSLIDAYAAQRLGSGEIELTGAELESALRDLAHLIMGLAEYQLS